MQFIADPAYIQKEFETRIREEDLTEEQLLVRMNELSKREWTVSELSDVERRRKASPEKVATWEHLSRFFTSLWWISRSFLQLKMVDRLEALTDEEREKELKPWADARGEVFETGLAAYRGDMVEGAKEGDGVARSLQEPKYKYYVPELSKEKILEEVRKERADWVRFKEVICDGLRIWGLNESSQFWPVDANSGKDSVDDGSGPNIGGSLYQKLIARKLKHILIDRGKPSAMNVAKTIPAKHPHLPESFREAILKYESIKTLDQFLREDKDFKVRFARSVSGVKGALKKGRS